jgi:NhaC family Na+:H+ antiporter
MSSTLGVSAAAYFPYAFLNLMTPVIAVILGYTGYRIAMLPDPARETVQVR